jgi:hypothetical protein
MLRPVFADNSVKQRIQAFAVPENRLCCGGMVVAVAGMRSPVMQ